MNEINNDKSLLLDLVASQAQGQWADLNLAPEGRQVEIDDSLGSRLEEAQSQGSENPISGQEVSPGGIQGPNQGEDLNKELETMAVYMISSGVYLVDMIVGGVKVKARIDSGAEVSIMSDACFEKIKEKPAERGRVRLVMADRQGEAVGRFMEPVLMELGEMTVEHNICVGPIREDFLLGWAFLKEHSIHIDWGTDTMILGEECIPLEIGGQGDLTSIARVILAERVVVPPNTAVRVPCTLVGSLEGDYVVEPRGNLGVLAPEVLCEGGKQPTLLIVNATTKFWSAARGKEVATACQIREVVQEDQERIEINRIQAGKGGTDHVKPVWDSLPSDFSLEQKERVGALLDEYRDVFATSDYDLGTFDEIEHAIDTGQAKPVKARMRRTPLCFVQEEETHLRKMLEAGVIQRSVSDWASAPVLIRKRDGGVRWCVDFRPVNAVTVKDQFPLPRAEECLDALAGNTYFSKLDANSAYWQVKIKEEDRKKTAFVTKYGLFEHTRMGFGLTNAPATFARVMDRVLQGLAWKSVLAFLDDILVLGTTFDNHLDNLRTVFQRFRSHGLKLKPTKCSLFQSKVEFLGRVVDGNHLKMSEKDVEVVQKWPEPKTYKQVEKFMGLANYHRNFVKNFAQLASPLYEVAAAKKFRWHPPQQAAFEGLKEALVTPPVLGIPNNTDMFILDTDASDLAIGAVLSQEQEGIEKVVAYASLGLTTEQKRYCTTRKELLAIVRFTR